VTINFKDFIVSEDIFNIIFTIELALAFLFGIWLIWTKLKVQMSNHDSLSEIVQVGTRLIYKKKITKKEGADFYCMVNKVFYQQKLLSKKTLNTLLDILEELSG
jgi:hypothetical protein